MGVQGIVGVDGEGGEGEIVVAVTFGGGCSVVFAGSNRIAGQAIVVGCHC